MKTALFILLALLAPALAAEVRLSVVLHKQTTVEEGFVALSQVAELKGDAELAATAGRVLLGRAPVAGQARAIELGYIRQRLQQGGVDTAQVAFYGYERPLVLGKGRAPRQDDDAGRYVEPPQQPEATVQPVAPQPAVPAPVAPAPATGLDEAVAAALSEIRAQAEKHFGHLGPVFVSELGRSRSLLAVTGACLFVEARPRQKSPTLGRVDYDLTLEADSRNLAGLGLTVKIEVEVTRVAAARAVAKGARLSAADLELRTVRTANAAEPGFDTLEQALDREARETLAAGETVSARNTMAAVLVRRGQQVRVRAMLPGGGSVLVTAGAMENGCKGDVIRLRRGSGKDAVDMTARVSGDGEAVAE
ncbi:MAG: flagellar basal body P-ring formation protein FlgA [Planctomycetes bacterium]|nr:flagellar basal body P-ring formation protein FlgA [Planctomycetota bacterium]